MWGEPLVGGLLVGDVASLLSVFSCCPSGVDSKVRCCVLNCVSGLVGCCPAGGDAVGCEDTGTDERFVDLLPGGLRGREA